MAAPHFSRELDRGKRLISSPQEAQSALMGRFKPLPASFSILLLVLAMSPPAMAQAPNHVLINEVMYNPTVETSRPQREWFELYNPTNSPVDLYGYVVEDNAHRMGINAHLILLPGEYAIICNNSTAFREDYPQFVGKLLEQVNGASTETDGPNDHGNLVPVPYSQLPHEDLYLNNEGDWIKLFSQDPGPNDPSGSAYLVDAVAWKSPPGNRRYDPPKDSEVGAWNSKAPGGGFSIQRAPNGVDTNDCERDFRVYPDGNLLGIATPGGPNTPTFAMPTAYGASQALPLCITIFALLTVVPMASAVAFIRRRR